MKVFASKRFLKNVENPLRMSVMTLDRNHLNTPKLRHQLHNDSVKNHREKIVALQPVEK